MALDFIYTANAVYALIDNRIMVNRNILTIPANRIGEVTLIYRNTKTERESKRTMHTLTEAVSLAERRSLDGRYKNFEFIIDWD